MPRHTPPISMISANQSNQSITLTFRWTKTKHSLAAWLDTIQTHMHPRSLALRDMKCFSIQCLQLIKVQYLWGGSKSLTRTNFRIQTRLRIFKGMPLEVQFSENRSNHQRSLTFSWTKTNSKWATWFDTKPHTSQKIESTERIILEHPMITARNKRKAHYNPTYLKTEPTDFGLISEETPDWGKPRQTPPITIQCGHRSHVPSKGAKIT